jgi:transcription-repair coupling factor (superfamily II helicase)
LEEGKIDIGTYGLLGKEVKFKNLGIKIIDEEQKFGVGHRRN